jgi:hypothetical protein
MSNGIVGGIQIKAGIPFLVGQAGMMILEELFDPLKTGLDLLNDGANFHPITGGENDALIDSMAGFEPDQGLPELGIGNREFLADFDGSGSMV